MPTSTENINNSACFSHKNTSENLEQSDGEAAIFRRYHCFSLGQVSRIWNNKNNANIFMIQIIQASHYSTLSICMFRLIYDNICVHIVMVLLWNPLKFIIW